MIEAAASRFDRLKGRLGQCWRVSGRAELVVDDLELFPFGTELEHGSDEVLAFLGVDPACPQNEVLSAGIGDPSLAVDLCFSVRVKRCRRVILAPGLFSFAGKNIVSRVVDERDLEPRTGLRQSARRF